MTLSHGFDDVTHKVKKKLSSSYKDLYVSLHKDESLYTSAVPLHLSHQNDLLLLSRYVSHKLTTYFQ